jgi:hypothetical protein
MISAVFGNEHSDILNQWLDDIGISGSRDECGCTHCWHRERPDRINQFLLEPKQIGCRLNYDSAKAEGLVRYVVILERLKLSTGWILLGKDLVGCCVHFGEIHCFDIPLQHSDVWSVYAA